MKQQDIMEKGKARPKKKNICEEAPVELLVNNKKVATFMCTPRDLNELAVGYLFGRGLIKSVDDVQVLSACDDLRKILVRTATPLTEESIGLPSVLSSGCGSGVVFHEELLKKEVKSDLVVSLDRLKQMAREMFDGAVIYKETGGMHCAALAGENGIVALREDVGRHNAVDKVLGKGLFLGVDFSRHLVITTGRLSSDMLLKAVVAGVPLVVSRSIPTSLGLEIAERMGVTVVGRIAGHSPEVYTHAQRVLNG